MACPSKAGSRSASYEMAPSQVSPDSICARDPKIQKGDDRARHYHLGMQAWSASWQHGVGTGDQTHTSNNLVSVLQAERT
jgi:hypothetical protein